MALLLVGVATSVSAQMATLEAHYMFSEGTGTTTADEVNSNNATITGATWSTDFAAGLYGAGPGSLDFAGGGATYLTAPDIAGLNVGTGSVSISFLMKTTVDPGADFVYLMKGTVTAGDYPGSQGSRYRVYSKASDIRLEVDDDSTATSVKIQYQVPFTVAGTYDLKGGDWNHVVTILDRSLKEIRIYVNGLSVTTAMGGSYGNAWDDACANIDDTGNVPLLIGDAWAHDASFEGSLDDVRIYSGVLTEAEVQTMYVAPTPTPPNDAGVQHWEIFN